MLPLLKKKEAKSLEILNCYIILFLLLRNSIHFKRIVLVVFIINAREKLPLDFEFRARKEEVLIVVILLSSNELTQNGRLVMACYNLYRLKCRVEKKDLRK